jgi:peptidylprolyl isomerase
MMQEKRRSMAIALGGMLAATTGLAWAFSRPMEFDDDLTVLPPHPAEVEQQLRESWTTLGEAIRAAEAEFGGVSRAAQFRLGEDPPVIEVLVYAQGEAKRITVSSEDASIIGVADVPRFPGVPVGDAEPQTLPSGVQIYTIKEGDGEKPEGENDLVKLRYRVLLTDGEAIQDYWKTDAESARLMSLDRLLPGWAEAMPMLSEGGVYKLILPGDMAYGARGRGRLPANAIAIIDLELFEVVDYATPPTEDELPGDPIGEAQRAESESGLVFYDLVEGEGAAVPADRENVRVKLHYTGYFPDGRKFDSSHDRGEPALFPLQAVIEGFREGISTMNLGGKRKLIVPPGLGYGSNWHGEIPPNSTLIFDIELIDIISAP